MSVDPEVTEPAAGGAGDAPAYDRVACMRLRQAIRSARLLYLVSGVVLALVGVALVFDHEASGSRILGGLLIGVAAFHAVALVRVRRSPLPWARRMALLALVEFGVAITLRLVGPGLDPVRLSDLADAILPLAGVLIAWDAVPRGELEVLLRERPDEWRRYLERYG